MSITSQVLIKKKSDKMDFRKLRPLSGGSVQITIPAQLIQELGWNIGEPVVFERKENSVIISPVIACSRDAKC